MLILPTTELEYKARMRHRWWVDSIQSVHMVGINSVPKLPIQHRLRATFTGFIKSMSTTLPTSKAPRANWNDAEIVRGHQSVSLPPLSSSLLSHTPQAYMYTHPPSVPSLGAKPSKPNVYCRRLPPSPLRSYLWSFGRTADTWGQVHVIQRHPPLSHGHLVMEAWYWEAWYCHFYHIIGTLT
jgi:hypothetical protein